MLEQYSDYANYDIINSMIATLEAKDISTYNHSTRVAEMAYVLGQILGMNNDELELIYISADLHDIGKIGIPDIILNKPGKLESDEWNLMKNHSRIGYDILSKARMFEDISKIVLHHHERWDGSGYPDGLKEDEIPLAARVLAICDSVDAMKSDRPYRKAICDEICQNEIRKNEGIMYDSKIAECMLENWETVVMKFYN